MTDPIARIARAARRRHALRNRRTDVLWSLVLTGVVLVVLPRLLLTPGADPLLVPSLSVVGLLFILFGGYILALEYRLAEQRERDRLDAAELRNASRKEHA